MVFEVPLLIQAVQNDMGKTSVFFLKISFAEEFFLILIILAPYIQNKNSVEWVMQYCVNIFDKKYV